MSTPAYRATSPSRSVRMSTPGSTTRRSEVGSMVVDDLLQGMHEVSLISNCIMLFLMEKQLWNSFYENKHGRNGGPLLQ